MEGDTMTVNKMVGFEVNDQVIFENINMIGTDQFTILGRPLIGNAKVNFLI